MVQESNKNLKIVKEFKKKINLPDSKFIFFGSRAKGNFTKDSDFDIIVISDSFKNLPWHKRAVEFQLKWNHDFSLEILCFTNEEVNKLLKNRWGVVREAISTGIEI
ncbi:MAG: nucleotidyltransferase domain-containing protein [Nanoarchaeota archaeon]|nr:nucleotidyltransferase domain-containing protein [Nanoarchaeota archaeon]